MFLLSGLLQRRRESAGRRVRRQRSHGHGVPLEGRVTEMPGPSRREKGAVAVLQPQRQRVGGRWAQALQGIVRVASRALGGLVVAPGRDILVVVV